MKKLLYLVLILIIIGLGYLKYQAYRYPDTPAASVAPTPSLLPSPVIEPSPTASISASLKPIKSATPGASAE